MLFDTWIAKNEKRKNERNHIVTEAEAGEEEDGQQNARKIEGKQKSIKFKYA